MGNADLVDRVSSHADATLSGAIRFGRSRSRVFSRRHCLPKPLVPAPGPRESDQEFHGGDPVVFHYWIAIGRLDSGPQVVRDTGLAVAFCPGRLARNRVGGRCFFLSDGLAAAGSLAGARTARVDGRKAGWRNFSGKPANGQTDDRLGCDQVSGSPTAGRNRLSGVLLRLFGLFLDADHAETPVRLFRCKCWTNRPFTLHPSFFRVDLY